MYDSTFIIFQRFDPWTQLPVSSIVHLFNRPICRRWSFGHMRISMHTHTLRTEPSHTFVLITKDIPLIQKLVTSSNGCSLHLMAVKLSILSSMFFVLYYYKMNIITRRNWCPQLNTHNIYKLITHPYSNLAIHLSIE